MSFAAAFAIVWSADRVAAIVVGALLLVGIYVFFFGRRKAVRAATGGSAAGAQSVTVVVKGGYKPDLIVARQGIPLTMIFDRREESPCSDEIVLPEFGIRRALPAHARTELTITPRRTGEFEFTCGMNMLHGKILVE